MEQPKNDVTPQGKPPEEPQEGILGRRELLKAIAATGGAVATSTLLPGRWTKPVVEAGLLPAHAQASPTLTATTTPTATPTATGTTTPTVTPTSTATPTVTPVPPDYTIYCDSTPGGGDITVSPGTGIGSIANITGTVVLNSGVGPVDGITVTMAPVAVPGAAPLPIFVPPFPRTANTDGSGVASFGTLAVTNLSQNPMSFNLRFSFVAPVTDTYYEVLCGQYDLPAAAR